MPSQTKHEEVSPANRKGERTAIHLSPTRLLINLVPEPRTLSDYMFTLCDSLAMPSDADRLTGRAEFKLSATIPLVAVIRSFSTDGPFLSIADGFDA